MPCSLCSSPSHTASACKFNSSVLNMDQIFHPTPPDPHNLSPPSHNKANEEDGDNNNNNKQPALRKRLLTKDTREERNFMTGYVDHASVAEITPERAGYVRNYYDIQVEGRECPPPIEHFSQAGLTQDIVSQLNAQGYEYPTPIQMQALPCVMNGRDIVGTAETGSGKTLCYILPMLMFLKTRPYTQPGEGPIVLILAPVRELVEQIYSEICKFIPQSGGFPAGTFTPGLLPTPAAPPPVQTEAPAEPLQYTYTGDFSQYQQEYHDYASDGSYAPQTKYPRYNYDQSSSTTPSFMPYEASKYHYLFRKVLGCVGGVPISTNIPPLQRGVDILVSTPGRLIDLANRSAVKLDRVSYLVFDEADRMLFAEMEAQVRSIVSMADVCVRQTVLFSATMPPSVERLVRSAVLDPIYIRVGSVDVPAETIHQDIIFMQSREKKYKLLEVLRQTEKPPVLVFCNTTLTVDYIVKFLREEQFHVAGIHGEKTQQFRFRAMKAFKEGKLDVLVASDLVSRGIDVNDVQHVVVFDLPDSIDDYIHRIGIILVHIRYGGVSKPLRNPCRTPYCLWEDTRADLFAMVDVVNMLLGRTGRAGKSGRASGFLTVECTIANDLRKLLKAGKHNIPHELNNLKQFGMEIIRGEFGDIPVGKK